MKKVNLNKVTELINNQVSNSLKEVKASKTQKPKETKESKKWRQQTRNELRKLEREMLRIQDHNSKEYKSAQNKYITFQKEVLKVDEAV